MIESSLVVLKSSSSAPWAQLGLTEMRQARADGTERPRRRSGGRGREVYDMLQLLRFARRGQADHFLSLACAQGPVHADGPHDRGTEDGPERLRRRNALRAQRWRRNGD